MENNGKAWTVKERQEAERLRLEGLEIAEIGKRLGRTRASVQDVLMQLGVLRPRQEMLNLERLRRGESNRDTAERLGVTLNYVRVARHRLRKMGVDI